MTFELLSLSLASLALLPFSMRVCLSAPGPPTVGDSSADSFAFYSLRSPGLLPLICLFLFPDPPAEVPFPPRHPARFCTTLFLPLSLARRTPPSVPPTACPPLRLNVPFDVSFQKRFLDLSLSEVLGKNFQSYCTMAPDDYVKESSGSPSPFI